ncbi:MAG: phosphoribosylformylglycinamidine cyclo-ligase [Bacillota bacterium]
MGFTYRDAGVDIDAGNDSIKRIREGIRSTFRPEVLTDIGGFGGLFSVPAGYKEPVLVASTDGVGTKLKIAFAMDKHDTIGQDLINHCINDILVQGAQPLFFMDYIAISRLDPGVVESIVSGLVKGCREGGCTLLGGETAEMPGFYADNEYDLAGTIVGIMERDGIILGKDIRPGDVLIGLGSNGLHTNGYSLVRKICFDLLHLKVDSYIEELQNHLGLELLKTHRCYINPLRPLLAEKVIKGMAHITGGGLIDNVPRMLPADCQAVIRKNAWEVPPVFKFLASCGEVSESDMYRTFNMGIGMVLAVNPASALFAMEKLSGSGEKVFRIGEVVKGESMVVLR